MLIGNYKFENPIPLLNFNSVDKAAIYTILGRNFDGIFQPIYIGESGQLSTRIDAGHHKYYSWLNTYPIGSLYISVLWMPSQIYTKEQRLAVESQLVNMYRPVCNN